MSTSQLMVEAAQTQGPEILAVCWILVIVPGLLMALRIWCKIYLSRGLGWDDAIVCISWVMLLIFTGLVTTAVNSGVIGRHINTIQDADTAVPSSLKLIYVAFEFAIVSCMLSKTSFAVTLLRIVTKTWAKILLWFIIISINLVMGLCAICYLVQCQPRSALWDLKVLATAKCWPTHIYETIALTAGAYSGFMDFILAILPWKIIWKLQMRRREKFGIAIAMSLGIFAAVAAFIKTSKLVNVGKRQDFTWYCSSILIWCSAETGLTIFAGSIPSLRILFIRLRWASSHRQEQSAPEAYQLSGNFAKVVCPTRPDPCYYVGGELITLSDTLHGSDTDSEKGILKKPAIKQTQEISVVFERNVDRETQVERQMRVFSQPPSPRQVG